jgi:hypothetical protein
MYSCLLKKLVPFALTFVVGSTIGGLFNSRVKTWTSTERMTLMGGDVHSCRMYRRNLVAETKPLVILFKPDARVPRGQEDEWHAPMNVKVTFGADGKVQDVERFVGCPRAEALGAEAEDAAWQIQFTPEMVNGVPVTVTREVEIHFVRQARRGEQGSQQN